MAISIGWRSSNGKISDTDRTWGMTTVTPHRWHSVMVISSMGHWTRWAEKSCKRRKSWQPFPSNGLRQIERRENSTNVLFHYGDKNSRHMRSNLTKYSINYRLNNMLLNSYIHPKEPKKMLPSERSEWQRTERTQAATNAERGFNQSDNNSAKWSSKIPFMRLKKFR